METKEIDINLQIERIGFGKFQIIVLAIVLLRQFSYSSTASLLVILEPYLRCYWKLSYMTAAWLVLPEAITKIVGSILLGKMSDRYGRRKTMILAFVFNSYLTLLFSLSTSTVLLSIIRGVIGLVSSSTMIAFTYAMEILPISKRKYMSIFAAGFFAGCGYGILVAMVSLEYLSWRWFDAFAETIPITLAALAVLFLPESPRYLMAVGKTDEAKETLQRIAKRNGALDRFSAFPSYESTNAVTIKHFKTNVDERQQQSKYEMAKRIVVVAFLQFYGDIVSATKGECGKACRADRHGGEAQLGLQMITLPERYFEEDIDYNETADVARKREQHVARVFQHYWRRWKKEYLIDLREYHKVPNKTRDRPNINIGDVVTVQDENIRNRIEWKLGRVADLIIGRDDVTRGARIQLANGNFIERPIQKLFPLELSSEPKEACATNEKTTRSEDKQEKTKRKAAVIAQESIRIIDQLEEDNEL
eukprot:gene7709-13536_t